MDKQDVFFGIDIGHRHHQYSFVDGERRPVTKTMRIREDRDGFEALKLEMDNIVHKKDEVRIHTGLEATGHCHQNLMAFLQAIDDLDVEVTCINLICSPHIVPADVLRFYWTEPAPGKKQQQPDRQGNQQERIGIHVHVLQVSGSPLSYLPIVAGYL